MPEAEYVFKDTDTSQSGCNDRKDGIRGEIGAVPETEVESQGHDDRVEENKEPEDEDTTLPRTQVIF
jgi:hypothetical protein